MSNYKILTPLLLILGALLVQLNYCTSIAACACVFTLLIFTTNAICKTIGLKKAIYIASAYIFMNIVFFGNAVYVIHEQIFEYLIPTSLLAVLISAIVSMKTIAAFENKIGFAKSSFFGLFIAAILDASIMSVYFMNYLQTSTILSIGLKEIAFKMVYGVVVLGAIHGFNILMKSFRNNKLIILS